MEEKYYNPEAIKELGAEIYSLLEAYKYLAALDSEHPDKKYFTEELKKAVSDCSGSMEDFFSFYMYYNSKRSC
jgi:ubiquinone/menaquinone biosynthesis C-methylase UbiE